MTPKPGIPLNEPPIELSTPPAEMSEADRRLADTLLDADEVDSVPLDHPPIACLCHPGKYPGLKNVAADRLRETLTARASWLDDALATERRNTMEQMRVEREARGIPLIDVERAIDAMKVSAAEGRTPTSDWISVGVVKSILRGEHPVLAGLPVEEGD